MIDTPPQTLTNPIPILTASQVSLAASYHMFSLIFGNARQQMSDTGAPIAGIEWALDLQVPPTTAKLMISMLQSGLDSYERQFGPIPHDPNTTVQFSDKTPNAK